MIKTEFERITSILEKTDINDYDSYESLWNEEIELLTKDITASIDFINNECSAEDLSWISEILEKIIEKTHSHEFLEAFKNAVTKYPDVCEKYDIYSSLRIAESILKQE